MTIETQEQRRNGLLKGFDEHAIRKAWFALTHVFLRKNSVVADIGCGDGAVTFAMAAMRPDFTFIGVDKDRRAMNKAKAKFELDNLSFQVGDVSKDVFDASSLDAIINDNTLHSIYSGARYNEQSVHDALHAQFKALKPNGTMFVSGYTRPPPDEFVMIEMPDTDSMGDDIADLSEPDFLEWYAEHARPKHDPGTGGFFLEPLPPRMPGTRLYRLPYQWAYEFILRKNNRGRSRVDLPTEYTIFTPHDFRKALMNQNARVLYAGNMWDDDIIANNYKNKFSLFDDDGKRLHYPPTSFVAVAQKMTERKSLYSEERRPALNAPEDQTLHISTMRNNKTGKLHDIVTPNEQMADIIPYTHDESDRLVVYLKSDIVRPIANAVPRSGHHIDTKRWSAHMIEPYRHDLQALHDLDKDNADSVKDFVRFHTGLIPHHTATIEKGPHHYPAPDHIMDVNQSYYVHVNEPKNVGKLAALDAQQVLDAIALGIIPNGTLELQIMALFKHLNITPENWQMRDVYIKAGEITGNTDLAKVIKAMRSNENRFKDVKGSAGELRAVRSTFVQDGMNRGALSGLHADNIDFVVHENETVNKAVVLPLTKNMKQEIHAGFLLETHPVPEKQEGKTTCMAAPSFIIPPHIDDEYAVRTFIAEKFAVLPDMVIKMGEPYFCHVSMTPQKIFPYGVAVPPDFKEDPDIMFLPLFQIALIASHTKLVKPQSMTLCVARTYKYLSGDVEYNAMLDADAIVKAERGFDAPDWGFPMTYKTPGILPKPAPKQVVAKPTTKPLTNPEPKPDPAPVQDNKDAYEIDYDTIEEILDIFSHPELSQR